MMARPGPLPWTAGRRRRQRGTSVLEALVGFMLVAVGMLGSAQMQLQLRRAVDLARQQADAVRLARHEFEQLRSRVSHDGRQAAADFDSIGNAATTLDAGAGAPTAFHVERSVADRGTPWLKEIEVDVGWTDREGVRHSRSVAGVLGAQVPALFLRLREKTAGGQAGLALGRHAAIPRDAHDLGDGRSIFKPVAASSEAWLFDNRDARIVARCNGVAAERSNRQLSAADLADCVVTSELLLAGRIRHAHEAAVAPDPAASTDLPLPMAVALQLSSSGHPQPPRCLGEAVRLVDIGSAGAARVVAVPIAATPASQGLSGWTEVGDRFWRYHCAVAPAPAAADDAVKRPHWRGRLQIVPGGWSIGSSAGSRRVCRYSADTDASGAIDRTAEAADDGTAVGDALVEQNYLIVDGTRVCPAAAASPRAAGSLPWSDDNPATVAHQP